MTPASRRVLPGFGLGLGTTITYLCLLVLIPLLMLVIETSHLTWSEYWRTISIPQAVAAFRLTFTASLVAASANVVLGLIVAWTLVRYQFYGKRLIDALVDVPFALPTAVAGLVYASLYVKQGWIGEYLVPLGIEVAYTRLGIILVLIFTGFPFVVRTVQPVLEDLDAETEEAASLLGASRWQTFSRVILPVLIPPTLTGFTLAFARAIGEYGSVVFISGNIREKTEIAPMLIFQHLEAYAYKEAAAIAVTLLLISFLLLAFVNRVERWSQPGAAPKPLRQGCGTLFHFFLIIMDQLVEWIPLRKGGGMQTLTLRNPHAPPQPLVRIGRGFLILLTFAILFGLVVVPLVSVFAQAFQPGIKTYWHNLVADSDTRHAIFLTLIVAPLAVALNTLFGIAAAYTIARFRFPGRTLLTTLIDLPFSVSPVVAGMVFVLFLGWRNPIGAWLGEFGYQIIFAPPGLVLATAFVTFPFVARELIPVLEANGPEEEIAARSLGANGWQMFWMVTLPNIKWGLIYGIILCNARAMGEFGAIYVVSGRIGGQTDTMPLRIEKLIQEYNQPAAFALASLLTLLALVTLILKVIVERKLHNASIPNGATEETGA